MIPVAETKILKNIQYTKLTPSEYGLIKFADTKTAIIYGVYPANALESDATVSGGYKHRIDLSAYNLTGYLWGAVIYQYGQGYPEAPTYRDFDTTGITLLSKVNAVNVKLYWIVIGTYS